MSWNVGEVWRLVRDQELIGAITIESGDFPWLYGKFTPQPAFDSVKSLFDEELALIDDGPDENVEAWEQAYDRIRQSLSLVSPRGPITDYLLHIEGDQAWFRWSDEPVES